MLNHEVQDILKDRWGIRYAMTDGGDFQQEVVRVGNRFPGCSRHELRIVILKIPGSNAQPRVVPNHL